LGTCRGNFVDLQDQSTATVTAEATNSPTAVRALLRGDPLAVQHASSRLLDVGFGIHSISRIYANF